MKSSYRPIFLTFIVLCSSTLLACHNDDFLPPNNLQIPMDQKDAGLSEERFHAVIDKVEGHYRPVVARLGAELKIARKWESPIVNAGTYRDEGGRHWHINLYGGFARHRYITDDGFALVICHEIGHHLGGAPKKQIDYAYWSSNEGQADYFATLKCLRHIFEKEDNLKAIQDLNVPEVVSEKCQANFEDKNEEALCIRTSMAGLSVAMVNAASQRESSPDFETPDETVVDITHEGHPRAQCRLDTYFMGSICSVKHYYPLSQYNEYQGTCHSELGYTDGLRPNCWYREK